MSTLVKVLTTIASLISLGFGVWHFFVPRLWDWYSYMDPDATELVVAVRAINVFFSLSLALFGVINILFVYVPSVDRFSVIVMLSATSILWLTRAILQIVYPQGSMNPALQYGMLATFIVVTVCYITSLCLVVLQTNGG
ncbi:MAG: hypothetical protein GF308_18125 [Candidatus Heimdallarchaeota archaeon]|nr:hypothetical protein [Candidatus Heimdallarchaeota archaeon]